MGKNYDTKKYKENERKIVCMYDYRSYKVGWYIYYYRGMMTIERVAMRIFHKMEQHKICMYNLIGIYTLYFVPTQPNLLITLPLPSSTE